MIIKKISSNLLSSVYYLLFVLPLFLSSCIVTTAEKEQMQMDIASLKKEIELHRNELNTSSENLKKQKADIVASLDKIKEEMSFLSGRFEESKFEAQKAKEALEAVQSRTIDQKEITAKFAAMQTTFSAMEKQLLAESEKTKGIEERIASLGKNIQEPKEVLPEASKKDIKEVEKEETASEPPKPETLYTEGFQQIKEKDFNHAIETFKKFINLFPNHDLADNAQYWIGEAYYAQKEYERAIIEFNEAIKKYPKGDKVAASLIKQGMAFYELGNKAEAKHLLERVKTKYPNTEEASIAKKKLEEMK